MQLMESSDKAFWPIQINLNMKKLIKDILRTIKEKLHLINRFMYIRGFKYM